MNDKQLEQLMRRQFESESGSQNKELTPQTETVVARIAQQESADPRRCKVKAPHGSPAVSVKPAKSKSVFRRKSFLAGIAAGLALVLALGILLPVVLNGRGPDAPPKEWRQAAYKAVQEAQFTPNFERIIYGYESETDSAQAGASQAQSEAISPLSADFTKDSAVTTLKAQPKTAAPLSAAFTEDIDLIAALEGYGDGEATAKEPEEERFASVRVEAERLEAYDHEYFGMLYGNLGYMDLVHHRTVFNQELALYCVENLSEPGVWGELPAWSYNDDALPPDYAKPGGDLIALTGLELYAMVTIGENGVVDIRVQATGAVTYDKRVAFDPVAGKLTLERKRDEAGLKMRFIIDPASETVEVWTRHGHPIFHLLDTDYHVATNYPYLRVVKDTEFIIASDNLYEYPVSDTQTATERRISVEEFRRDGDERFGVSASFNYTDENDVENEFYSGAVCVSAASGSNQSSYMGSRVLPLRSQNGFALELYSTQHVIDGQLAYRVRDYAHQWDGSRKNEISGIFCLKNMTGIQAYHLNVDTAGGGAACEQIELADGTVLAASDLSVLLDSIQSGNPMDEKMFFQFTGAFYYPHVFVDDRVERGDLTFDSLRGDLHLFDDYDGAGDAKFSDFFGAFPLPAGIGFSDGVDFTKDDNVGQIVKTAAVLGVENAYLNPESVLERLNALCADKLSFGAK
ncbi:MAG: hypothetical protein FWD58_07275 [Firmicutes bacterium]|nr:hypothetical protein [Bacillota bacterium]